MHIRGKLNVLWKIFEKNSEGGGVFDGGNGGKNSLKET